MSLIVILLFFFFFKQKTAYEMRISDWSSDVCSSDLDMNDELHRRIIVVQHNDLVHRRLLGLRTRLDHHPRGGTAAGPAIVVAHGKCFRNGLVPVGIAFLRFGGWPA